MDDADNAQTREQEQRDRGINAVRFQAALARWTQGVGEKDCVDCDDEIPEERRRAVPGANRCTRCQEIYERTMRMRGK